MTLRVHFVGNLGADPDAQYTQDGTMVVDLRVATKNVKGDTAWTNVTAWGRLAEVCNEYLSKGDKVMVEGRLEFDPEYGGPEIFQKRDGSAGASFEITATDIEFISTGSKEDDRGPQRSGGRRGGGREDRQASRPRRETPDNRGSSRERRSPTPRKSDRIPF